jgi:NAD(P)-dependent dehydrogenase (short-subunit alcohol dehydrogenase family)
MTGPEEIAAGVLWLCSDAASFAIGRAMSVDGGFVVRQLIIGRSVVNLKVLM